MPRNLTSQMLAALALPILRPAIFCEITFLSGPIYLWTGYGDILWNSIVWRGVGALGTVSVVEEGANVQARGIVLTLSGIDPTVLSNVLDEACQELPVILWMALFDGSFAMIPSPVIIWSGQADQPTVEVSSVTATVSFTCESRLLEMNVSVERRRTNDDQQLVALGDVGLQWVVSVQEQQITWGIANAPRGSVI